jgi:enterochelin esterase-like enzyme
MKSAVLLAFVSLLSSAGTRPNQSAAPPRLISPQLQPNYRVTLRFYDPNAKEVSPELASEGIHLTKPSNALLNSNLLNPQSEVLVAGPAPTPWDVNDVPHGVVHHHFYHSAVVGDNRDFYVYTPPDYNPRSRRSYPVLYLLHGYSDNASGWTSIGHANVILDNLIAQGKAKPMIVVMPLGYGAPEILSYGFNGLSHDGLRQKNFNRFTQALLTEVMPRVESAYRVKKARNDTAIAGLSMGGAESLLTGLNHLDQFSWVGSFSAGRMMDKTNKFDADFPDLNSRANSKLHLLWVACGTEDHLISMNRQFRQWLKAKKINHTDIETPGRHTWIVWRRNLANFLPLLFR